MHYKASHAKEKQYGVYVSCKKARIKSLLSFNRKKTCYMVIQVSAICISFTLDGYFLHSSILDSFKPGLSILKNYCKKKEK